MQNLCYNAEHLCHRTGMPIHWRCKNVTKIVISSVVLQQEEDLLCTWCFGAMHSGRYCPSQSAAWSEVQTREAWTVGDSLQSGAGCRPTNRKESCGNRVFGASHWPRGQSRWRGKIIWDTKGAPHLCWIKRIWLSTSTEALFVKDAVSALHCVSSVGVNINVETIKCNLTRSALIHFRPCNTDSNVCFSTWLWRIFNKIKIRLCGFFPLCLCAAHNFRNHCKLSNCGFVQIIYFCINLIQIYISVENSYVLILAIWCRRKK